MSVSAFHHHFKAATATSPPQYIKTLRGLHRARLMMLHDGLKAGVAADKVGWARAAPSSAANTNAFEQHPSEHAARFRSGQLRIVEG